MSRYRRFFPFIAASLPSGPSYDPDAQAWFDAVSWGASDLEQKQAVNDFIVALKDGGVWSKLDRLWLIANRDQTAGMTCLKSLEAMTPVNSPTFTQWRGIAGNGSSSYVNTNYNPATDGVNFTLNSASFGAYARTWPGAATSTLIGASDSNGGNAIRPEWTDNKTYSSINAGDGTQGPNTTLASRTGLFTITRTASNACALYQGATLRASSSAASSAVQNTNMCLLALNQTGAQASAAQISVAYAGGALTSQNITDLNTAVENLRSAIGW